MSMWELLSFFRKSSEFEWKLSMTGYHNIAMVENFRVCQSNISILLCNIFFQAGGNKQQLICCKMPLGHAKFCLPLLTPSGTQESEENTGRPHASGFIQNEVPGKSRCICFFPNFLSVDDWNEDSILKSNTTMFPMCISKILALS